jgi:hypothetical protein
LILKYPQTFPVPGFVLYIAGDGMHAGAIPPFKDLENGRVLLSLFSRDDPSTVLPPVLFLPHGREHLSRAVHRACALGLRNSLVPAPNDRCEILCEIKEIEAADNPFSPKAQQTIYRYRLNFDPADPKRSTYNLVEVASVRVPPDVQAHSALRLYENPHRMRCNGRLGTAWSARFPNHTESDQLFFSLSSSFTPSLTSSSSSLLAQPEGVNPSSTVARTELTLVELVHASESELEKLSSLFSLCPSSGSMVVFWMHEDGRSVVNLHEISAS